VILRINPKRYGYEVLSIYLSTYISIYLSIYIYVHLYISIATSIHSLALRVRLQHILARRLKLDAKFSSRKCYASRLVLRIEDTAHRSEVTSRSAKKKTVLRLYRSIYLSTYLYLSVYLSIRTYTHIYILAEGGGTRVLFFGEQTLRSRAKQLLDLRGNSIEMSSAQVSG